MARIITILVAVLIVAAGAAFLFFKDQGYTLKFTEDDLRARLEERLPFAEEYLSIFNVQLDNPRIALIDGTDRIGGGMDAIVTASFLGNEFLVSGAVDMTSGIRYEPSEGAFYLNDPRIEDVRLDGMPESITSRAKDALSLALAEFYRERPIYVLSNENMRQSAAKMVLRDVLVKDEVLHVTLGLKSDNKI